ncbi:hypothetical protein QQ045_015700 [Rhodiola kirilowii]
MSNAEDDERSLLEAIKRSRDSYRLVYGISDLIYPYTSFIIRNVTALRLDGMAAKWYFADLSSLTVNYNRLRDEGVPSISGEGESESTVAEFNFITSDFSDIGQILKEIERASSAKMDEHEFALSLPRIPTVGPRGFHFTMEFILVGTLAAFAVTHGVWLLVLKFVCTNSGEEDINAKRQLNCWKSMDSLYSLITAMFDVVSVIHLFVKNVVEFIPKFLKDEFDNLVLLSTYWVIRGVVACSSQCKELPENRYVIKDSGKLTDICDKLVSIHERLQKLDSMVSMSPYASWALPSVARVVSGCPVPAHQISIFNKYMTSLDEAHCEFIWLPIHSGPWITSSEEQYTKLLETMPWYTVHHPTFLTEKTKKFIRDVWMFHRKPIAVVLNEKGNVVCPNAMHMMYIWGARAFPFTRMRERTLWVAEMRLSTIVLDFDTNISSMMEASKWIVLYGGIDVEWIRKFITCIRKISDDAGTSFEMIYVGKNAASENIGEVISSMCVDMPQIYSPDSKKIWYFWTRLESLLISRYQTVSEIHHTIDPIIREVKNLLSYASAESWACLITPSSDMIIHDLGDTMLQGFMEFKLWKQHLHSKDFSKIFLNHIEQLRQSQVSDRSCSRIVLNIDNKDVVQSLECPHCNHFMENKVQYRCCHMMNSQ